LLLSSKSKGVLLSPFSSSKNERKREREIERAREGESERGGEKEEKKGKQLTIFAMSRLYSCF